MGEVGAVRHPVALEHDMGPRHFERPDRLRAIDRHLEGCGLEARLDRHAPEPAPRELVASVHDDALLDLYERLDAEGGGRLDVDTSLRARTLEAALRASQGTVDAVQRILEGRWTGAFVLMRPPGHHAPRQRAPSMGFCFTNHVAVAACRALADGVVRRVVILDWDAHHGNGTQDIFYADPRVLYVSLHQYPWYPGSGDATELGEGEGHGTTIDVPLPAGTAEGAYVRAMDEIVEPAVERFEPDLVLVSAGYDAHAADPLCTMRLSAGAFFRLTERAAAWGPGPVCVLEGGYDLDGLSWGVAATISALLGEAEPVGVPTEELGPLDGTPEADGWVDRAAAIHAAGRGRPSGASG